VRSGEAVGYGLLIPLGWADAVSEVRQAERELLCIDPHLDAEKVRRPA
jgi:hypothetical protein